MNSLSYYIANSRVVDLALVASFPQMRKLSSSSSSSVLGPHVFQQGCHKR